jgi:hypothetical protein
MNLTTLKLLLEPDTDPYSLGPMDPDPVQSDKRNDPKKVLDVLIEGLEASSVTGSPS